MKWYPSDWRGEPNLRLVSRAARSLWVDLLGLMHESTLIGYLYVNSRIPSERDLARIFGDTPEDLAAMLKELRDAGVFSETKEGVIFSRKMVRDAEISEKGRADIRKRGGSWSDENPSRDPIEFSDSPPNSPLIAQRPEARDSLSSYPTDNKKDLLPEAAVKKSRKKKPTALEDGLGEDEAAAVAHYWNGMAEECGLSQVKRMTATRREKIKARVKEVGFMNLCSNVIDQIPKQPFLTGKNARGWKCDFDWILEPSNLVKIEERKFEQGGRANGHG